MPRKRPPPNPAGRTGHPVSLSPLKMDDAVSAIFAIKPDDVRRIVASKPTRKKRAK